MTCQRENWRGEYCVYCHVILDQRWVINCPKGPQGETGTVVEDHHPHIPHHTHPHTHAVLLLPIGTVKGWPMDCKIVL